MTKPKILIWDIETSPNQGLFFDVWNGTNLNFITKERSVLTIAYKWFGEKETKVLSVGDDVEHFKKDPYDDKFILAAFLPILNEADYIVAHYGDKFDIKMIQGRLFINRLPTMPVVPTVDTCKLAKKYFKLNSNKLDYIAKVLGMKGKMPMNWSFWKGCAEGDIKAIKKMAAYNIEDVKVLEKVFIKMLPYIDTTINLAHFGKDGCPSCGHKHIEKRGFFHTKLSKRQRFRCKKCNKWFHRRITV